MAGVVVDGRTERAPARVGGQARHGSTEASHAPAR